MQQQQLFKQTQHLTTKQIKRLPKTAKPTSITILEVDGQVSSVQFMGLIQTGQFELVGIPMVG